MLNLSIVFQMLFITERILWVWTFKVSLTKGVNTITIVAEDRNGKLTSDSIEIIYAPSLPAKARAFKSGRAPSPTISGTYTFIKKKREKTRKTKSPPKISTVVLNKRSGSSGSWCIQVESLKNKNFVDKIITELKDEGYPAYYVTVTSPGKSTWYKIRTGSYKSKAEAQKALDRLKKYKGQAIIVFDKTTRPADENKP
ncbi:MAG: SPOR domain-containing protein [Deltaproteobacteria bacterium]|nr:SPOR domain-containing protein [Deltaproteobacteria bacterium]